jgi:hypothetical protein
MPGKCEQFQTVTTQEGRLWQIFEIHFSQVLKHKFWACDTNDRCCKSCSLLVPSVLLCCTHWLIHHRQHASQAVDLLQLQWLAIYLSRVQYVKLHVIPNVQLSSADLWCKLALMTCQPAELVAVCCERVRLLVQVFREHDVSEST